MNGASKRNVIPATKVETLHGPQSEVKVHKTLSSRVIFEK